MRVEEELSGSRDAHRTKHGVRPVGILSGAVARERNKGHDEAGRAGNTLLRELLGEAAPARAVDRGAGGGGDADREDQQWLEQRHSTRDIRFDRLRRTEAAKRSRLLFEFGGLMDRWTMDRDRGIRR